MDFILSLILNLVLVILLVGVFAFFITWMLNPTASPKEIFHYWKKVYSCK